MGDWIYAGEGQDIVDGGKGRDTLHLVGEEADWSATADGPTNPWCASLSNGNVGIVDSIVPLHVWPVRDGP